MKSRTIIEYVVQVCFLLLLALFLNPFDWWMPTMLVTTMVCVLFVVFVIFGIFIWKEKPIDEREQMHRMFAGRVAFLSGAGILVCGIIVQEMNGSLDRWLVYSLATMIITKAAALRYSTHKL